MMSRLQSLTLNLKLFFGRIISARKTGLQINCSRHYSKLSNWGTKKSANHIKLIYYPEGMADPQVETILAPLRAAVKKQVSTYFEKNIYKPSIFNFFSI